MAKKNHWENLARLRPHDEVKFVIKDRADFTYALSVVRDRRLDENVLLFSPVHGELAPADLVSWMLEVPLAKARLNLQQHKYVWPAAERGV